MAPDAIPFDRAVEYYDRTRSLAPDTERRTVELLLHEFGARGPVLEIGVGTGLLSLPLRDAGVEMLGLDLSMPMLRVLHSKGDLPIVQGDATKLPFASDSFGSALAIRVFHLLPEWAVAAKELVRTVRHGGVIAVCHGGYGGLWNDVMQTFADAAEVPLHPYGLQKLEDLDELMRSLGTTSRPLGEIIDEHEVTWREVISQLEDGLYSWTWPVDGEVRRRAGEATRGWVGANLGSIDEPSTIYANMPWRAYDLT